MLRIYSVYDAKSEAHARPFFARTHGEAIRAFSDLSNDPQSNVGMHPEDFSLWYHGEFEDTAGVLQANEVKVHLAHASEYAFRSQEDVE